MEPLWPFKDLSPAMVAQLYDQHHEGILITDYRGLIVYYNQRMSELDDLGRGDVLGLHISKVYKLDDDSSVSLKCLKTKQMVKNMALYYRTNHGKLVNTLCHGYPIWERGHLAGAVCHVADYTSLAENLERTARNYDQHPQRLTLGENNKAVPYTFASLIGGSAVFAKTMLVAKIAAQSPSSVFITGATGTGKELFAQAIHNHGPRRAKPFCPVNCAAIPETLLEAVLFGTSKGAFTGAIDKPGLFEMASGGTIFLDEINSMPLTLQSKLLRVLQERRLRRIGSLRETELDLKIISAMNIDPKTALDNSYLRPDLFYRLGVVVISLPSLNERPEDIEPLVRFFVKKYNRKLNLRIRHIDERLLEFLKKRDWPGNVRELEHAIETAMNFAGGDKTLAVKHLVFHEGRDYAKLSPLKTTVSPGPDANNSTNLRSALYISEKEALSEALNKAGGKKSEAARELGLSRQSFYYKRKKYGL